MGAAIAHRLGSGRTIVVSDVNSHESRCRDPGVVRERTRRSREDRRRDVAAVQSPTSPNTRRRYGPITNLVHTAGVSPEQADVDTILHVDLLGVALVLEQFGEVIEAGGAGVVIASMAGHFHPAMDSGVEHELASTPSRDLLAIPACAPASFGNSQEAYGFAKRANHLRVAAAASAWGKRGARINSISPGVISTAMGIQELNGSIGDGDQGDDRRIRCRADRHTR